MYTRQHLRLEQALESELFWNAASRPLVSDPSIFLCASNEELERERMALTTAKGLPSDIHGKKWSWRALLPAGDYMRLCAAEAALSEEQRSHPCVLVTLSQTPSYQRRTFDTAPCLIKNTRLYRIGATTKSKEDRLVLATELFAMQLLPVNLPSGHYARKYFNEHHLEEAQVLSLSKARALTGNAMCVAVVGSVLLNTLGSVVAASWE